MLTDHNVEAQCSPTRSALMTDRYSLRTGCSTVMGVDPSESEPYEYANDHVWLPYYIWRPRLAEFNASLQGDQVPFGAPVDFNPKTAAGPGS